MNKNMKEYPYLEARYATIIFVLVIFLMVLCVASFVYAIYAFNHGENIFNNILELIYMAFHFVVLFLAAYFCLSARKHGLLFTKRILYNKYGYLSKMALIIAIIIVSIAFIVSIYFTLAFFIHSLPRFNFPIVLVLDLINTPLTIWSVGLFFILHPLIFIQREKEKK